MRRPTTVELMAAAFTIALAMVLVIRLGVVPGENFGNALRATARWSFVWLWLAFTASALATLFGRGRELLQSRSWRACHLGLPRLREKQLWRFPSQCEK
jgi:hypothetical protein